MNYIFLADLGYITNSLMTHTHTLLCSFNSEIFIHFYDHFYVWAECTQVDMQVFTALVFFSLSEHLTDSLLSGWKEKFKKSDKRCF